MESGRNRAEWLVFYPQHCLGRNYVLAGFDSITIDLQHGLVDYQTALGMLQAIGASGVTPIARVPWNELAIS